jgi:hypothetical protein
MLDGLSAAALMRWRLLYAQEYREREEAERKQNRRR